MFKNYLYFSLVHPPIFHTHFLPASILVKFISKTLHLQLPHSTHEIKTPPPYEIPPEITHNNKNNNPTMNEQTTWHDTDTKLTLWHGLNPKNALLALLVSVALPFGLHSPFSLYFSYGSWIFLGAIMRVWGRGIKVSTWFLH